MSPPSGVVRARAPKNAAPPKLHHGALEVAGREVPLYSGAMHYWRLAPSTWREGLESLKEMGFTMVETYIPWSVHATSPDSFDFGERDPRKDVGRFLEMAAEVGLWAFVRPGPHINAEMTLFGIPEWVIYDAECQARSPRQAPVILPFPPQMFPVPSYASKKFLELTAAWYRAVGAVVREHVYPRGRVVLTQVDNEAAYYFRNATYDQDYHPDAVERWQSWLAARYQTVEAAAAAHRKEYSAWEDATPPLSFDAAAPEELAYHLDWAEFREVMIADTLKTMTRSMQDAGFDGLPVVHNVPLGDGGAPISVAGIEESIDVVGFDYYHPAREHHTIKRRTLYLAGTSRLPYAPEMGAGAPPWFTPFDHQDSLYCAMAALAYGLRGFNLYMAVDRDRWCGAPVDSLGAAREDAPVWGRLVKALRRVRFHQMKRSAPVGLVFPRDYARLSRVTHLFGVLSPANLEAVGATPVSGCREDALGMSAPIQTRWWRLLSVVAESLSKAGVPFVYVDSEAESARLREHSVLVAPTFDFADDRYWNALQGAAEHGVEVVLGPNLPHLNRQFSPSVREAFPGAELLNLLDEDIREAWVGRLAGRDGVNDGFSISGAGVEITVHRDRNGPRLVFVLNPSQRSTNATLTLPRAAALRDLVSGDRLDVDTSHQLELRGREVRALELLEERGARESSSRSRPPAARRGGER